MKNILLALTCFAFSSCSNMESDAEKVCEYTTQSDALVEQLYNFELSKWEIQKLKEKIAKLDNSNKSIRGKYDGDDKSAFLAYLSENCDVFKPKKK